MWTELKRLDEMRVDGEPDPVKEASDLLGFLEDRRTFEPTDTAKGGQNSNLSKRTRIGRYVVTAGRSARLNYVETGDGSLMVGSRSAR